MDIIEQKREIRLRCRLVIAALSDGRSKSFEEAIEKAEKVYKWIMLGPEMR